MAKFDKREIMKRRNKLKTYSPCTLDKFVKANKQIQDLKKRIGNLEKECEHLWLEEATSYRRFKKAQRLLAKECDKVEYLKFIVLSPANMTDITKIVKAKEEYMIAERRINQKANEECKQFSEVLTIRGKRIKIDV